MEILSTDTNTHKRSSRRRLFLRALTMLCLTGAAAVLSTCASFPAPKSAKDTLVVVPLIFFNSQATMKTMTFSYQLNLENIKTKQIKSIFISSADSPDYKYITDIPAGQYIIKEYVGLGFVGRPVKALSIEKYLTVRDGSVSVLPIKIIIVIEDSKNPDYVGTIFFDYKELDEPQEKRILNFISAKEKEKFDAWKR